MRLQLPNKLMSENRSRADMLCVLVHAHLCHKQTMSPCSDCGAIASLKCGPLALMPGKTRRLPSSDVAAMPLVVERSFETASDVMAGAVTRHRLGRSQAPAPRTANDEEVVV